jgi:predicted cupin superfamily sugar epimerase
MKRKAVNIIGMQERNKANYWIQKLDLKHHPEGGHYREVYRSGETISETGLPARYTSDRSFSTSIYYLLQKGEFSAFHRIKTDEIWYFHDGDPLEIMVIASNDQLTRLQLGITNDASPQIIVKAGDWFAARTLGNYSLAGCNVAPGFDFADFEMATYEGLVALYPSHHEIIRMFCPQS